MDPDYSHEKYVEQSAKQHTYVTKHPERRKASATAYYQRNKERINARKKLLKTIGNIDRQDEITE